MRYLLIGVLVAIGIAIRLVRFERRRRAAEPTFAAPSAPRGASDPAAITKELREIETAFGDVRLVAGREIRERLRGKIFRVGTLVMLVIIAGAIIIPSLHKSSGATSQTIGVVGSLPPEARALVGAAATADGDVVSYVAEDSLARARAQLRSGAVDLVVVDGARIELFHPIDAKNSPVDPSLVSAIAEYLGVLRAETAVGLSPGQIAAVDRAPSVPVAALQGGSSGGPQPSSIIGLVLVFMMLSQYDTWILIGVMQEKSSRVVEVLLAAVRPIRLLAGKVLGIGLVALGQATVLVGFALVVSAAVGSDLLHGSAPIVLLSEFVWLVLGYAFYCWVYAAAGSTAERQDQVQTLALPLSLPILIGYVFAITVASTEHASLLFKVLAYLPPTAPFCMPILVSLDLVSWWQFVAAALISVVATVATARFAARIYRRAVLRTGGRVSLRELFGWGATG